MNDITARMLDRLVDAVTTAERTGIAAHLPTTIPAATREAFLRRNLIYRNHTKDWWELQPDAVGMGEEEIERRVHDAAEEAARPRLQRQADLAFIAQWSDLPEESEFVTVAPARGVHSHHARRADKGLRPLCRQGKPVRTTYVPTDGDPTCPTCALTRRRRAKRRAELDAARKRVAVQLSHP